MTTYHLTVTGAPRTKKTSNRLVKVGRFRKVLPSKAWEHWVKHARVQGTMDATDMTWHYTERMLPLAVPLHITAIFYRDARRGDLVGYMQGLADLLEKRGVIANDRQLVNWDGTRLDLDRDNPRTEVTLTEVSE